MEIANKKSFGSSVGLAAFDCYNLSYDKWSHRKVAGSSPARSVFLIL